MHAGIVNAGAFLANRFAPLFVHADEALHLAFAVGFVTAILGSALMMVQNDVKKALAYSTMGQMGYMMLEVGSGAFALAIYHMMVHGLFKASLFLGSGGVIGEARQSPNISDRTLFDFYFRSAREKIHGWIPFFFFVVTVPAIMVWVLFETLGEGVSTQGTFLFFFFAWAAGSRVAYALYHGQNRFWKMFLLMMAAFGLALAWYLLAEHSFGGILYPDRALFENLFSAAQLPWPLFYSFWTLAIFMLLASWSMVYCRSHAGCESFLVYDRLYNLFYQTLVREFYVLDIAEKAAGKMLRFSLAINQKLHF
jgi:NADH-quinone oxidoreductase subunit L